MMYLFGKLCFRNICEDKKTGCLVMGEIEPERTGARLSSKLWAVRLNEQGSPKQVLVAAA